MYIYIVCTPQRYIPINSLTNVPTFCPAEKNELLAGSTLKLVALAPKMDRNLPAAALSKTHTW